MHPTRSLACVFLALLVACSAGRGDGKQAGTKANASQPNSATYAVSPVTGPSWLTRLGLTLSQTHMGQMGGTQSMSPAARRESHMEANNGLRANNAEISPALALGVRSSQRSIECVFCTLRSGPLSPQLPFLSWSGRKGIAAGDQLSDWAGAGGISGNDPAAHESQRNGDQR